MKCKIKCWLSRIALPSQVNLQGSKSKTQIKTNLRTQLREHCQLKTELTSTRVPSQWLLWVCSSKFRNRFHSLNNKAKLIKTCDHSVPQSMKPASLKTIRLRISKTWRSIKSSLKNNQMQLGPSKIRRRIQKTIKQFLGPRRVKMSLLSSRILKPKKLTTSLNKTYSYSRSRCGSNYKFWNCWESTTLQ